MKILQINKFYYKKGGSEEYMFTLTDALIKRGHKVIPFAMQSDLNTRTPYEKYFAKTVNLDSFSFINIFKIFYNFNAVKKLKELIIKESPDIAHLHNIDRQLSPAIIRVLKKHKIPVVQTLHDYKLICPNYKLFSKGEVCYRCEHGAYFHAVGRKCIKDSYLKSFLGALEAYWHAKILKSYEKIDLFLAPSKFMKDVNIRFGVPENKIKVIYNLIDLSKFKDNSSFPPNNHIVYFGRLSQEKGLSVLISAMAAMASPPQLKIVGSGTMRQDLEDAVERLGMLAYIEFTGKKFGKELRDIVADARAIILPSVWPENMPYSMLEAMASGKVVIVSDIGGMIEIIKNDNNGFIFKSGDSNELAKKIKMLDKVDLQRLGANARKTVEKLDKSIHAEKIEDIYKMLINKNI